MEEINRTTGIFDGTDTQRLRDFRLCQISRTSLRCHKKREVLYLRGGCRVLHRCNRREPINVHDVTQKDVKRNVNCTLSRTNLGGCPTNQKQESRVAESVTSSGGKTLRREETEVLWQKGDKFERPLKRQTTKGTIVNSSPNRSSSPGVIVAECVLPLGREGVHFRTPNRQVPSISPKGFSRSPDRGTVGDDEVEFHLVSRRTRFF